jgi:hypothetical protein
MQGHDTAEFAFPMPAVADLARARQSFEANEPRDLFYRAATELVTLSLDGRTSLSVAEAVAVLLQTWNASYYRYHHHFDSAHFADIEAMLAKHTGALRSLRAARIDRVTESELTRVAEVFADFETVLGPVGAAKCLHLLAPDLFALWDRAIAAAYGVSLGPVGSNGARYCAFLRMAAEQCRRLGPEYAACSARNPLKALDEYNYCRFTRKWI